MDAVGAVGAARDDPVLAELEDLQLDRLSPLEALQKLYELKSRLS